MWSRYIIVSMLILSCLGYGSLAAEQNHKTFKVVKVIEGDLIKVLSNRGELLVRLVGIDAPEVWKQDPRESQPFALRARDYLANLIENKLIKIRACGIKTGKYVAGEVFLGKKDINLEMVKEGYAEVLKVCIPSGLNLSAFERAEAEARRAKKGIWSLGDKYVSPATWRKRRNAKSICSILLYGILQQGVGKK